MVKKPAKNKTNAPVCTTDDLLALLEAAEVPQQVDGYTAIELMDTLGLSYEGARQRLRRAVHAGRWQLVGKRQVAGIDGRFYRVPVYAPVKL